MMTNNPSRVYFLLRCIPKVKKAGLNTRYRAHKTYLGLNPRLTSKTTPLIFNPLCKRQVNEVVVRMSCKQCMPRAQCRHAVSITWMLLLRWVCWAPVGTSGTGTQSGGCPWIKRQWFSGLPSFSFCFVSCFLHLAIHHEHFCWQVELQKIIFNSWLVLHFMVVS